MAIGPLESFVFPGVLTRTINEASSVTAAGQIRFPAFVGISAEELRVSDFEMVRGSSAIADNLILDEDESSQFTGSNNKFTVANFPIVTGDGSGKAATSPQSVIVTVNAEPVAVNAVNGLTGEVTLVAIPKVTDTVRANYYFKRRDTYIVLEDLSVQVDGTNYTFKVESSRICKGDNGGRNATDVDINGTTTILYDPNPLTPGDEFERTVPIFQVNVNGSPVTVTHIYGSDATFTLQTPPAALSELTVSYFTNTWQDTYDILPAAQVSRIVKCGLSQDTNDYSNGQDYCLSTPNLIHWGHSKSAVQGIYTAGSDPLVDNVLISLTDTLVYGKVAAPVSPTIVGGSPDVDTDGNELNDGVGKTFTLPSTPVLGDGKGTPTENPADIIAYVGLTWAAAYTAGPVTVLSIKGSVVTLAVAPTYTGLGVGEKVYVTYYENLLVDEAAGGWLLTNRVPGGAGVGKYTISSELHRDALDVVQVPPAGPDISPMYPLGVDNTQVDPMKANIERVTVTFDGVGGFVVSSKLGPAFITNGKTGSVTAYNANKGYLGKTYLDPTTGFRVTFDNVAFSPLVGDTVRYDIGDPTTTTSPDLKYITAKAANIRAIPGLNMAVATTSGGAVDNTDDTVIINTYNKSGLEPNVGDFYYVSFDRIKTDYTTKFLTNMRDVQKYYGPIDINNKLTVAANLAFQNGARAVALKQIKRVSGGTDASVQDYIDGIDTFNEPLPNGLRPSLMQPLTTNSEVIAYLKQSNAIQSSIRYRNERTSLVGFALGTLSDSVIQQCQNISSEKVTAVYPDGGIIGITDTYGNEVEYALDGSFLAAATAGRDVSPVTDIATPMTNATVTGFKRLYRRLDNVTASLVANAGCTVLEEQTPVIRILMYLTTDMSTVLTRDPRVVEVKHFVQQGIRAALNQYIGQKNLPKLTGQVKDTVGSYFKSLQSQELITAYTGISVKQNASDPSTLDVEAYYSPVFPLNWIVVTLNLRSSV